MGENGCQEKARKNLFPTLEHWQLSVWQARLETSKILLEAIVNDNLFIELLIYLRDSHILIQGVSKKTEFSGNWLWQIQLKYL